MSHLVPESPPPLSSHKHSYRTFGALFESNGLHRVISAAHLLTESNNEVKGFDFSPSWKLEAKTHDLALFVSQSTLNAPLQLASIATSVQNSTESIFFEQLDHSQNANSRRSLAVFEEQDNAHSIDSYLVEQSGLVVSYFDRDLFKFKYIPVPFDCAQASVGLIVNRTCGHILIPVQSLSLRKIKIKASQTDERSSSSTFLEEILTACVAAEFEIGHGDSGGPLVYYYQNKPIVLGFIQGKFDQLLAGSGANTCKER
jgi:hypothetical protein